MHFLWNRTAIVRERPIAPRRAQKILSATFCRARIFAARPVSGHSTRWPRVGPTGAGGEGTANVESHPARKPLAVAADLESEFAADAECMGAPARRAGNGAEQNAGNEWHGRSHGTERKPAPGPQLLAIVYGDIGPVQWSDGSARRAVLLVTRIVRIRTCATA